MDVSSVPQHTFEYSLNQPQVNPAAQVPASYNVQGAQTNPCSGVIIIIIIYTQKTLQHIKIPLSTIIKNLEIKPIVLSNLSIAVLPGGCVCLAL